MGTGGGPDTTSERPVPGDYDGDGLTDLAIFDVFSGMWYVRGVGSIQWGRSGDVPVPGDYTGDGITEIAVYRPTFGEVFIWGSPRVFVGASGLPLPADYNGDGVTEVGTWRNGWFVVNFETRLTFPSSACRPVWPGDFDGDGRADFGQFRCDVGVWQLSSVGDVAWGQPHDLTVALDRDGDGRDELGIYRPSNGSWYFYNTRTGAQEVVPFGTPGRLAVPASGGPLQ